MSEDSRATRRELPFLASVRIERLFGYRLLEIDFSEFSSDDAGASINIIYGDNGSGKTTLLRFVYELLHHKSGGGHKSWIASLPFHRANITLVDGRSFDVAKHKGLVGAYTVSYTYRGTTKNYRILVNERNAVSDSVPNSQHSQFLEVLSSLKLDLFFITDDRQYLTTADIFPVSPAPKDKMILRYDHLVQWHLNENGEGDALSKGRSLNVSSLAETLADLFRNEIARAGIYVQRSTNAIYSEIINRISTGTPNSNINKNEVVDRIYSLHARMRRFVDLGAISDFDHQYYIDRVIGANSEKLSSINLVIAPFLDSLAAQLDALGPSVERMDSFLYELNNFYSDKQFRFSYNAGLSVFSGEAGGEVSLDWFSSGERQLFIILASVFLAQGGAGLVLIDEPELSLNVVWQRKFVPALHRLSKNAPVQYILASHSPEILNSEFGREFAVGH